MWEPLSDLSLYWINVGLVVLFAVASVWISLTTCRCFQSNKIEGHSPGELSTATMATWAIWQLFGLLQVIYIALLIAALWVGGFFSRVGTNWLGMTIVHLPLLVAVSAVSAFPFGLAAILGRMAAWLYKNDGPSLRVGPLFPAWKVVVYAVLFLLSLAVVALGVWASFGVIWSNLLWPLVSALLHVAAALVLIAAVLGLAAGPSQPRPAILANPMPIARRNEYAPPPVAARAPLVVPRQDPLPAPGRAAAGEWPIGRRKNVSDSFGARRRKQP